MPLSLLDVPSIQQGIVQLYRVVENENASLNWLPDAATELNFALPTPPHRDRRLVLALAMDVVRRRIAPTENESDISDSRLEADKKLALLRLRDKLTSGEFRDSKLASDERARLECLETLRATIDALAAPATPPGLAGNASPPAGDDVSKAKRADDAPAAETPAAGFLETLKPSHAVAYQQFKRAEQALTADPQRVEKRVELQEAYDWIKAEMKRDGTAGDLQSFSTWARYVRGARNTLSEQVNLPRTGRSASKSIVALSER